MVYQKVTVVHVWGYSSHAALTLKRDISISRADAWYVQHSYTPCSFRAMYEGEENKNKIDIVTLGFFNLQER